MATIDKSGRIRGSVGNYVHRLVNGKQVLQSAPKPRKPSGGTIDMNDRFRGAAELSGIIHQELKNFAFDRAYSYLHGRLTGLLKRQFFSDMEEQEIGEYLPIDKDNRLQLLFPTLPIASKQENHLQIEVPEIKASKKNNKLAYAEFISYEVKLIGFADDEKDADNPHFVEVLKTERFPVAKGFEKYSFDLDLNECLSFGSGILLVAIRAELFQFRNSAAFLNSKEINPVSILGIWKLS